MLIDRIQIILLMTKAFVRNCTALLSAWILLVWAALFVASFFLVSTNSYLGSLNYFAFFDFITPQGRLNPVDIDPHLRPSEASIYFSTVQWVSLTATLLATIPSIFICWSQFENLGGSHTALIDRKPSRSLQVLLVLFVFICLTIGFIPTNALKVATVHLFFALFVFINTNAMLFASESLPKKSHPISQLDCLIDQNNQFSIFFERLLFYVCAALAFGFIFLYMPFDWHTIAYLLTHSPNTLTLTTQIVTFCSWTLLLLNASLLYTKILFKGISIPLISYLYRQFKNPKEKLHKGYTKVSQKILILFSTTEEEQRKLHQLRIAKHTKAPTAPSKGVKRL